MVPLARIVKSVTFTTSLSQFPSRLSEGWPIINSFVHFFVYVFINLFEY